jgi:branched-chain amino acid transport system ATP-binding protein
MNDIVGATARPTDPVLQIDDVHAHYGSAHVLQGVSLTVGSEPVAIIGRNGMGKTTLCRTIMGLTPRTGGSVSFRGQPIAADASPRHIARLGIGYVPQGRRIFPTVTVSEHLRMMAAKPSADWTAERVYDLYPNLAQRRDVRAGSLSGGEQQMLAISRALLLNGTMIILDEPSEGLAPIVVDQMIATIKHIASTGVGVLLIEQQLRVAGAVAEHLIVMVNGRVDTITSARELAADRILRQRLLGVA